MGYSEFIEWLAFYENEPFGGTRSDLQTALLAATIVNVQRGKGKQPIKITKFLIDWWKDGSKPQALLAKFKAATAAIGNAAETDKAANDGSRTRIARRRAGGG